MYSITFCQKNKEPLSLEHIKDKTILETAEACDFFLPYCCRAGSCSACAGKLLSGTVNQQGQSFLDAAQVAAGYVLTCAAYPTSNIIIQTHQENELY